MRSAKTCLYRINAATVNCPLFGNVPKIFRGFCLDISRSLRSRLKLSCAASARMPKASRCPTNGGVMFANCATELSGR